MRCTSILAAVALGLLSITTIHADTPPADGGRVMIADGLSDDVLQRLKDATVFISSTYTVEVDGTTHQPQATGSGFVVDPSGLIVTNRHVVDCGRMFGSEQARPDLLARGTLESIRVRAHSGTRASKEYVATLVAIYELPFDLALLRIEPEKPLTALELGDEATLKETRRVWAAGFPRGNNMDEQLRMLELPKNPDGPDLSIRGGEITSLRRDDRQMIKAIETSCLFEPGNSGGPLIDETGRVFGINTYLVYESRVSLPVRHVHEHLGRVLANERREPVTKTLKVDAASDNSFHELWKKRKPGEAIEFDEGEFTVLGGELTVSGRAVMRGANRKSHIRLRSSLRFKLEKGSTLEITGLLIGFVSPAGEQPEDTLVFSSADSGEVFISECTLNEPPRRNALCCHGNVRAMVCNSTVFGFACSGTDSPVLRLASCSVGGKSMELAAGKHAFFGCTLPKLTLAGRTSEDLSVSLAGCHVKTTAIATARGHPSPAGVEVASGRMTATECWFESINVGGQADAAVATCSRCVFTSGTTRLRANATAELLGCLFATEFPVALDCLGPDADKSLPGVKANVEACRFELDFWSDGLSDDERRKRAEECCFGIEIAEGAIVTYKGNLFTSADAGIGVRLDDDAEDKDGGGNEIRGPGTLKTRLP